MFAQIHNNCAKKSGSDVAFILIITPLRRHIALTHYVLRRVREGM